MKNRVTHFVYEIVGHMVAFLFSIYWDFRDYFFPPREKAILFVAHPDDDVLFFHTFLKEKKPYVILLTTGGILRRVVPFYHAMRYYGVRYRAFDMNSRAVEKEKIIEKIIENIVKRGEYEICATHNCTGEYGHKMHKCVNQCVRKVLASEVELYTPVEDNHIENYPLEGEKLEEKKYVLQHFYKREYPTIQTFEKWILHERLERIQADEI